MCWNKNGYVVEILTKTFVIEPIEQEELAGFFIDVDEIFRREDRKPSSFREIRRHRIDENSEEGYFRFERAG